MRKKDQGPKTEYPNPERMYCSCGQLSVHQIRQWSFGASLYSLAQILHATLSEAIAQTRYQSFTLPSNFTPWSRLNQLYTKSVILCYSSMMLKISPPALFFFRGNLNVPNPKLTRRPNPMCSGIHRLVRNRRSKQ